MDDSEIKSVYTNALAHELGHALKMSHAFSEGANIRYNLSYSNGLPYENEVLSKMNYDADEYPITTTPTFLDKYNLIRKWGIQ